MFGKKKTLLITLVVVISIIITGLYLFTDIMDAVLGVPASDSKEKENHQEEFSLPENYVEGVIVVSPRKDLGQEEVKQLFKDYDLEIRDKITSSESVFYELHLPKDKTVKEMLLIVAKDDRVESADPNFYVDVDPF